MKKFLMPFLMLLIGMLFGAINILTGNDSFLVISVVWFVGSIIVSEGKIK